MLFRKCIQAAKFDGVIAFDVSTPYNKKYLATIHLHWLKMIYAIYGRISGMKMKEKRCLALIYLQKQAINICV